MIVAAPFRVREEDVLVFSVPPSTSKRSMGLSGCAAVSCSSVYSPTEVLCDEAVSALELGSADPRFVISTKKEWGSAAYSCVVSSLVRTDGANLPTLSKVKGLG